MFFFFVMLRRHPSSTRNDTLYPYTTRCRSNVDGIDDKILNKAAEAGRPWWEWAATHERAFDKAYETLGVLAPSAEPRATGHITQMVDLMQRLIERGHAYRSEEHTSELQSLMRNSYAVF